MKGRIGNLPKVCKEEILGKKTAEAVLGLNPISAMMTRIESQRDIPFVVKNAIVDLTLL